MFNLKAHYYAFRWWLRKTRNPPVVVIAYYGQLTPRPQVHVSVQGAHGLQGVYTFDADDMGNAKATMYGTSLAHIMQRRLVDEREVDPIRPKIMVDGEPFEALHES